MAARNRYESFGRGMSKRYSIARDASIVSKCGVSWTRLCRNEAGGAHWKGVVARVEAFITGWGLAEALKRAEAYYRAGADAILMHSKKSKPDEVLSFMKEWQDTCPVVIVPTMYYSTPTEAFEEAAFSVVIWANHLLRASITAMQQLAARLYKEQSLLRVEDEIVSVKEIFRLQDASELKEAEGRYLPKL